jgi:hypothetical protein
VLKREQVPWIIQAYGLKVIIQHQLIFGGNSLTVGHPASVLFYQRASNFSGHGKTRGQRVIRRYLQEAVAGILEDFAIFRLRIVFLIMAIPAAERWSIWAKLLRWLS